MSEDPKSAIKLLYFTFFLLLGPVRVKAACIMLVKLTPGLVLNIEVLKYNSCQSTLVNDVNVYSESKST